MRVVLVRHGKAEPLAATDAARALTARGHEQARATAAWLAAALDQVGSVRVLASPYRRAQETAAAIAAVLGRPVETVADITPDDDPRRALSAIEAAGEGAEVLVVVSHMPLVAGLAGWLEDGVLNTGRGFDLAEARMLEAEPLAPGVARQVAVFVPGHASS